MNETDRQGGGGIPDSGFDSNGRVVGCAVRRVTFLGVWLGRWRRRGCADELIEGIGTCPDARTSPSVDRSQELVKTARADPREPAPRYQKAPIPSIYNNPPNHHSTPTIPPIYHIIHQHPAQQRPLGPSPDPRRVPDRYLRFALCPIPTVANDHKPKWWVQHHHLNSIPRQPPVLSSSEPNPLLLPIRPNEQHETMK
jgi:hypothetical protein